MSATDINVDPCGFEGPEKRLEVHFKSLNSNRPLGLRSINRDQWQELLDYAKCTILCTKSNNSFDAYVLSESSLFVFPLKIMIKTCGTTTLLKIIPKLLEYAITCELQVEFVMFSRKKFIFPNQQLYPHGNFSEECKFLNTIFEIGSTYMVGPESDCWYVYIADYHDHPSFRTEEQTMEIMMRDLDRECAQQFYRSEEKGDTDKFPGVQELIEGSETDEFNFRPCGYSMNGLNDNTYYTIHVTPEPHCSYASFETNLSLSCYLKLINAVLNIFKPASFTLTIYTEKRGSTIQHHTHDMEVPGYKLLHRTFTSIEGNCDVLLCNFKSETTFNSARKIKSSPTSADLSNIKSSLGIN